MAACLTATLLLLLISAHCCVCAAQNATKKVTFHKQNVCPCSSSLRNFTTLSGLRDARSCFVECAVSTQCSLLHYNASEGQCYFAAQQQMPICNESVSSHARACESFVKQRGVMNKLLVFFDFRLSLANQADASRFSASVHGGVTRNSTGAHFPNDPTSYIEVDTQGNSLAASFLSHDRNFSFFAKYERRTYYQSYAHCFHDCSGRNRGCFGDRDRKLWVQHNFPLASDGARSVEFESIDPVTDLANNLNMISLGASFTQGSPHNFYFNGSANTGKDLNWSNNQGAPLCLRLGGSGIDGATFNGRIICYAIATEALSLEEMKELDGLCD